MQSWEERREDLFLIIMVGLLLMLSVVIWVAFCIAVKKTAKRFLELKRQRRREVFDTTQELPSYEQAISMSSTPSPNPVGASTGNERLPPYKAPSTNRVLRVAPERPGALPTIVLPPSYESSIGDSPIYTVSSTVGHTPL